jgi:hypothetical protein
MLTFKISGSKYRIPTCWDDVSFAQYIELLTLENKITEYIHLFTGIPREIIYKAELRNLENISLALSFLTTAPKFEAKPTRTLGPYVLPEDITVHSVGQFEDLRGLMAKAPKQMETTEDNIAMSELYLEACAIYAQKVKYGHYDYTKVPELKEELRKYSCIQVVQTGAFFFFKPHNLLPPTMKRSQNIRQRLKKLIQDLPGFQKTLDSLQRSLTHPKP